MPTSETLVAHCQCGGDAHEFTYADVLDGRMVSYLGCVKCKRIACVNKFRIPPPRPTWAQVLAQSRAAEINGRLHGRIDDALPLVSVIIPAYNHERFIGRAIESVREQATRIISLEIIVVDDGSTDDTPRILDQLADGAGTTMWGRPPMLVLHQANAGAPAAINNGLACARGRYVAILNSDDEYCHDRLSRMIGELEIRRGVLAFSRVELIDDRNEVWPQDHPFWKQLRDQEAGMRSVADPVHWLLEGNASVSTGNFVFRRSLMEKIGGFGALSICHDWDWLLSASYEGAILYVDEPLYRYRWHGENKSAHSRIVAAFEMDQVMRRFFARLREHPLMQKPETAEQFREYVITHGMEERLWQTG